MSWQFASRRLSSIDIKASGGRFRAIYAGMDRWPPTFPSQDPNGSMAPGVLWMTNLMIAQDLVPRVPSHDLDGRTPA